MAQESIWLAVSNVRIDGGKLSVQVVGDRADKSPEWWEVSDQCGLTGNEGFRTVAEALDRKKVVLVAIGIVTIDATTGKPLTANVCPILRVTSYRVQQVASPTA